jgi:hypothetical protein
MVEQPAIASRIQSDFLLISPAWHWGNFWFEIELLFTQPQPLRALDIHLGPLGHERVRHAFLQPIAALLARKTTQWTARARAATDRRELCRGSLDRISLQIVRGNGCGENQLVVLFIHNFYHTINHRKFKHSNSLIRHELS